MALSCTRRIRRIIADADPLADISNLRRVRYVATGGRLYESAPLWQSVGFRP